MQIMQLLRNYQPKRVESGLHLWRFKLLKKIGDGNLAIEVWKCRHLFELSSAIYLNSMAGKQYRWIVFLSNLNLL